MRLKGDVIDYRGAVEYYDGIYGWTGICADTEHYNTWIHSGAASVVCAQLGYEGGTAYVMRYFIVTIRMLINPRRACAVRVTVVGSVCLSVCVSVNISLINVVFFSSAPPMVDLSVAVDCRGNNAFSLVDCELDAVVLTGGCSSQDAGWIECRETSKTMDDNIANSHSPASPLSLPPSLPLSPSYLSPRTPPPPSLFQMKLISQSVLMVMTVKVLLRCHIMVDGVQYVKMGSGSHPMLKWSVMSWD